MRTTFRAVRKAALKRIVGLRACPAASLLRIFAMHEIGIASTILECVEAEARRHPGERVMAVGVRIGALASVDKDALDFAFESLTRDTDLSNLKLEIEWCPWRQRCLACSEEYEVRNMDVTCPKCNRNQTTCIGGTELDIAYLEMEEQPCAKS
jgi:hydrogenase nickel incorporation protein HypA/HybF